METIELKPCAHCGGEVRRADSTINEWIFCDNCGVRFSCQPWVQDMVAAWNRRTPDEREYIERIREALNGYADSDLAALASVMMSQRRRLAEALWTPAPLRTTDAVMRLAESILDDESAPMPDEPSYLSGAWAPGFRALDSLLSDALSALREVDEAFDVVEHIQQEQALESVVAVLMRAKALKESEDE